MNSSTAAEQIALGAEGLFQRANLTESALPAILSGKWAFDSTVLVGRPEHARPRALLERIDRMFTSGRLSNHGPMNDEFESAVAEIAGASHCIASCNATIALELAISALGMKGEVIVPSFTFVATVHALWRQGIRPVFCDIDPETHCLDVASVEAAITSETTGILGVHLWGNVGNTDALEDARPAQGLKLLFDAAHAFGCGTGTACRHRRRRRSLQLPRHEIRPLHRRRRRCHQRCGPGAAVAPDGQFRFFGRGHGVPPWNQRQDDRSVRRNGADVAEIDGRLCRTQPPELSAPMRTALPRCPVSA